MQYNPGSRISRRLVVTCIVKTVVSDSSPLTLLKNLYTLFDVVISPSLRTKYDASYLQFNSMRYCKGTKNIGRLCEGGFIAPILPANSLSRLGRWHYVCSSLGRSSVPAVRRGSAPNVGNLRIKGANAMVRESIPSNLKRW